MSTADAAISAAEAKSLFGAISGFPALLLAVSGGPDSTALLWLIARWLKSCERPPKVVAVTVDHGLRPAAKREAKAVQRLAGALGVEHRTLRWTGRKPKTGLQEAARNARYGLLCALAREIGARHVLTGHTLDDQAETILIRLSRGSGLGGLAGMRVVSGLPVADGHGVQLVRPLLGIAKSRLIATLKTAKIPYADDPTNRDSRFARSRMRALMRKLAAEGLTADRLGILARRAHRAEDALFAAVNEALTKVSPQGWGDQPVVMSIQAFNALPPEIRLRLLGRAIDLKGDEGPVELAKLEAVGAALDEPLDALSRGRANHLPFRRTLAGALVTLTSDRLIVERAPPRRSRSPKTALTKPERALRHKSAAGTKTG